MSPIAIFYHCCFWTSPPLRQFPSSVEVVMYQMELVSQSGLLEAASHFSVGINGDGESRIASEILIPSKAQRHYHGLKCHNENRTIMLMEKWVPSHPDWYVLYFHAKGSSHAAGTPYLENSSRPWMKAMMKYLVGNWRQCVSDMDAGFESVGCHFMRNLCDGTQNIWAGNFWWAKASFLATLPPICARERLKVSGIDAAESRYESEVWIGNGKRVPLVKEYLPNGGEGVP